ncbi:hypothetical protein HZS_4302 [Henneguya salminicola]|nr:hypothetical protein HZS_4302 [Henneguya salminicola]
MSNHSLFNETLAIYELLIGEENSIVIAKLLQKTCKNILKIVNNPKKISKDDASETTLHKETAPNPKSISDALSEEIKISPEITDSLNNKSPIKKYEVPIKGKIKIVVTDILANRKIKADEEKIYSNFNSDKSCEQSRADKSSLDPRIHDMKQLLFNIEPSVSNAPENKNTPCVLKSNPRARPPWPKIKNQPVKLSLPSVPVKSDPIKLTVVEKTANAPINTAKEESSNGYGFYSACIESQSKRLIKQKDGELGFDPKVVDMEVSLYSLISRVDKIRGKKNAEKIQKNLLNQNIAKGLKNQKKAGKIQKKLLNQNNDKVLKNKKKNQRHLSKINNQVVKIPLPSVSNRMLKDVVLIKPQACSSSQSYDNCPFDEKNKISLSQKSLFNTYGMAQADLKIHETQPIMINISNDNKKTDTSATGLLPIFPTPYLNNKLNVSSYKKTENSFSAPTINKNEALLKEDYKIACAGSSKDGERDSSFSFKAPEQKIKLSPLNCSNKQQSSSSFDELSCERLNDIKPQAYLKSKSYLSSNDNHEEIHQKSVLHQVQPPTKKKKSCEPHQSLAYKEIKVVEKVQVELNKSEINVLTITAISSKVTSKKRKKSIDDPKDQILAYNYGARESQRSFKQINKTLDKVSEPLHNYKLRSRNQKHSGGKTQHVVQKVKENILSVNKINKSGSFKRGYIDISARSFKFEDD